MVSRSAIKPEFPRSGESGITLSLITVKKFLWQAYLPIRPYQAGK
jgi:hypothetical protein